MITQTAPDPEPLRRLIAGFKYKPGWTFTLYDDLDRGQGSRGMTLDIVSCTYRSYREHPLEMKYEKNGRWQTREGPAAGADYFVHHYVLVPPASFNERSWRRWLLQELIRIETHEACEFFEVDGEHPYAPNHGPGNDPYMVVEIGTEDDARTSFRGELNPQ